MKRQHIKIFLLALLVGITFAALSRKTYAQSPTDLVNYDLTDTAYNAAYSVVANGDADAKTLIISGEGRIDKAKWDAMMIAFVTKDFLNARESKIEIQGDGVIALP
ncbi:hypothetical protein O6R05_01605 [Peptoniphilus equinus]|uniref:Uncharacterized protein n=1 Tax=Peptoniphilus equinus TaxID=3016343 RepID=A0ABY7QVA0_9FIRM|nr:hypothetical protein [Peptoniphilus equinus]WBW50266.1 hypothetical protein O6R05_01605 [Peptoniphilus equinus]